MKCILYLALVVLVTAKPHNSKIHGHGHGQGHGHAFGNNHHDSQINTYPHYNTNCGVPDKPINSDTGSSSYIVGGEKANPHSLPWQVALMNHGSFRCGGSLVRGQSGDLYVVTAAHCVYGVRRPEFTVVVGAHVRPSSNTAALSASEVVMHPNYNDRTLVNDVAVITLVHPPQQSNTTKPICITTKNHTDYLGNTDCLVSGWGTLSSGGSLATELMQVYKPLKDKATCKNKVLGFEPANMLCGGFPQGGSDACQGDSGGPYVCKNSDNSWSLVGVVSWGYGCAEPDNPGVYADVYELKSFIEGIINPK